MKALNLAALAASTVLFLASATAWAKPGGKQSFLRQLEKMSASVPRAAKPKTKRSECAQFGGTWQGTCTDSNGESWTDEMTVEQDEGDCDYITIWGLTLSPGGAEDVGSTHHNFMYRGVVFPDWNSSGSILRAKVAMAGRQLGDDSFFLNSRGDLDFQIVNGQLVYRSINDWSVQSGGQHTQERDWETCTYDRAPARR